MLPHVSNKHPEYPKLKIIGIIQIVTQHWINLNSFSKYIFYSKTN